MVKTSSSAEGTGLTTDEGTKIPPALWPKKKKTKHETEAVL